jgi:hypothetical protein
MTSTEDYQTIAQIIDRTPAALVGNEEGNAMTTHLEEIRAGSPEKERQAIDEVERRLYRRFIGLPPEVITDVVEARYRTFRGATLREYVPVLVEHAARNDLDGWTSAN